MGKKNFKFQKTNIGIFQTELEMCQGHYNLGLRLGGIFLYVSVEKYEARDNAYYNGLVKAFYEQEYHEKIISL